MRCPKQDVKLLTFYVTKFRVGARKKPVTLQSFQDVTCKNRRMKERNEK